MITTFLPANPEMSWLEDVTISFYGYFDSETQSYVLTVNDLIGLVSESGR